MLVVDLDKPAHQRRQRPRGRRPGAATLADALRAVDPCTDVACRLGGASSASSCQAPAPGRRKVAERAQETLAEIGHGQCFSGGIARVTPASPRRRPCTARPTSPRTARGRRRRQDLLAIETAGGGGRLRYGRACARRRDSSLMRLSACSMRSGSGRADDRGLSHGLGRGAGGRPRGRWPGSRRAVGLSASREGWLSRDRAGTTRPRCPLEGVRDPPACRAGEADRGERLDGPGPRSSASTPRSESPSSMFSAAVRKGTRPPSG